MDHVQRSNAVGSLPSYLPDGDPGRQGGNTYTGGNSTEPTIQDYENIFGPSARDIKTDLQRFKRHGRWHLPDVLKGPNPWLTDRIDGLITDATNSPFTTKLLPYMYKEDVDGKMKWNVWSFDEGMASRVPYESAARTLTQSKRSFSGYMVRQGMAIVLEHNFMMSPKGRENFKNQLNQLIGSIQYTNDLDVHMALILAPSHAKTMRERYYSLDKSPSQVCREYVDLFGMMQKNVNALDILIEEGKAILRTWGGPMPDFLLCNSKLTFQMTMTPEKTNYITQGVDGIKRLKQGPDLTSYRGLSVIHSRSFSMETGQAPRDILRRRVRTAEYYRILPSKKNINREFEFYNEERDTWFTLSFTELLRYAMHINHGGDGSGRDNAALIHRVYKKLLHTPALAEDLGALGSELGFSLGAPRRMAVTLTVPENILIQYCRNALQHINAHPVGHFFHTGTVSIAPRSLYNWDFKLRSFDMGVKHIHPQFSKVWKDWSTSAVRYGDTLGVDNESLQNSLTITPRFTSSMAYDFYESMQHVTLNDPFSVGQKASPGTPAWFTAFSFYVSLYKRGGLPMDFSDDYDAITAIPPRAFNATDFHTAVLNQIQCRAALPQKKRIDITAQILGMSGGIGSVNHPLHLIPSQNDVMYTAADWQTQYSNRGHNLGHKVLMTYELLGPLLREYNVDGKPVSGIKYLHQGLYNFSPIQLQEIRHIFRNPATNLHLVTGNHPVVATQNHMNQIIKTINLLLGPLTKWDQLIPDSVYLARAGICTWPMFLTSLSHLGHPAYNPPAERNFFTENKETLEISDGHLNLRFIDRIARFRQLLGPGNNSIHPFLSTNNFSVGAALIPTSPTCEAEFKDMISAFNKRLFQDPFTENLYLPQMVPRPGIVPGPLTSTDIYMSLMPNSRTELAYLNGLTVRINARVDDTVVSAVADEGLDHVVIDMDRFFLPEPQNPGPPAKPGPVQTTDRFEDVEIVVVRPNIEHNMLGVIMGLGGSELGHTLWGQTELSVYDDSMHGIWGMSYKYHERAIVFNEKNLIRLWDIAYDGYNGGKDDTYVDWTQENTPNGYKTFQQMTMDVSKNYRGPSMMVMAFVHDREAKDDNGQSVYDKNFKRNWPSPIVYHDSYTPDQGAAPDRATLPLDYDNLQVVEVEQFRVFNNPLYYNPYRQYREMMPAFHEMHMMRKSAGQASADSETHTDSLAFQGSMRIKETGRGTVEEIQGSGHHGPDYTGVASVRAGKGQKVAVQAPIPHRLI